MSVPNIIINTAYGAAALLGVIMFASLVGYIRDPHRLKRPSIGGPFIAAISDAWLAYVSVRGKRSEYVYQLHSKYGKIVRIAPNHISVCDAEALQAVYGHGTGTLKPDFYDAFISIRRGLFTTRNRGDHARKRRLVSHAFSPQSVLSFEPHVRKHLRMFCAHWDLQCARASAAIEKNQGIAWFDCLPGFGYLTFDIIGDLAFGAPFGMTKAQKDMAPIIVPGDNVGEDPVVKYVPAVETLNRRGEFGASMGVVPVWLRPLARRLPFWARAGAAVKAFEGMAIAAVDRRLMFGQVEDEEDWDISAAADNDEEGKHVQPSDLLEKLLQGKDENGDPIGKEELTAEALTLMVAGSDTTSNSCCAITYFLAANPSIQQKLQAELDHATPSKRSPHPSTADATMPPLPNSSVVTRFSDVKSLPYLQACVNEGLRLHSTSGIGLPRAVPPGSTVEVCGEVFEEGTILSVPTYNLHRDEGIWGSDASQYRPERWLERAVGKEFNPFSFGPRACVGRNLAMMELMIIISTIFRRYEFRLQNPDQRLDTTEGFLRKPVECIVGIKRRAATLE